MSIAFRSDDQYVGGLAAAIVPVNKPAGTIDGDFLLAFVSELGVATITEPAGWNLIGTQDVDTDLRVAAYWKLASSEGAAWTWNLGASVLAWGWVGAFTGVDPTDPVYNEDGTAHAAGGTSYTTGSAELVLGSIYVGAVSAYRTATGAATTWTSLGTEYADFSTNLGAATDTTGAVFESSAVAGLDDTGQKTFTASQSQTKGATWIVPLRPLFTQAATPFDFTVELALGEDPDSDSSAWVWTDVTEYVRHEAGIQAHVGRSSGWSTADPARINLTLDNRTGRFTPGNPGGAYYPDIRRNTPLRVSVDGVGVDPPYELVRGYVDEWPPSWSTGDHDRWVSITASGRFRRLGRNSEPLHSAVRRRIEGDSPRAYWPMEDESGSTSFASAVSGVDPMFMLGAPSLGGDSNIVGSAPLPTLAAGDGGIGEVPGYAGGEWLAEMAIYIPSEPAGPITLLSVYTNGSAARWRVSLTPGASTGTVALEAFDNGGTDLLAGAASFTADDSFLYGQPLILVATAVDNGASVDWTIDVLDGTTGSGSTGTTASMDAGAVTSVRVLANSSMAGIAVGHVAVFDDITLYQSHVSALDGEDGEASSVRLTRICREEGVPFTLGADDDDNKFMGPQPRTTLLNMLLECEAVEGGILFDSSPALPFTPGLVCYMPLVAYLNRDVDITIDLEAGELAPPFAPTYDDRFIVNDMEASRPGGSTARVVDMDGPVGVTAEGRYKATRSYNTYLDTDLPNLAGWEVHVGTVEGMRYPMVRMDFRRNPALFQAWLESPQIGAKVRLENPPTGHAPDDVDLIVVGWDMFLNPLEWYLAAVTIPAQPYSVGVLADTLPDTDPNLGWLDWDSCTLDTGVDSVTTTFLVNADPLDTTNADAFPRDCYIGGELVTVTACAGGSQPQTWTVTRSVNEVVKSHDADVVITLAHPIILTL